MDGLFIATVPGVNRRTLVVWPWLVRVALHGARERCEGFLEPILGHMPSALFQMCGASRQCDPVAFEVYLYAFGERDRRLILLIETPTDNNHGSKERLTCGHDPGFRP